MAYVDRFLTVLVARLQKGLPAYARLFELRPGRYAVVMLYPRVTEEAQLKELSDSLIDLVIVPLFFEGAQIFPYATLGWSWSPRMLEAQGLLRSAFAAMREASTMGANACRFLTLESANRPVASSLDLENSLRQAILHQENGGVLSLVYQPQVELICGRMIGVEALLRWKHPLFGDISPNRFIPVAEHTGLIAHLGAWVLHAACAQAMAWIREGLPPVRVAVNLSAYQLKHTDVVGEIRSALLASHLPPEHLGVEVTESMLMENLSAMVNTLQRIRDLGVEISLDDFGTGYSSLSYLRQLPINTIKVDRSFVHDVTALPQDVSITRAIINMGHSLQMNVLAEGVETEGQLALLVANQCDMIQGYFFSKPVESDRIKEMLREGKCLDAAQVRRKKQRRTLLLVDDEDNVVSSLKRLVRREGYNVLTANNGPQALQCLAENEIDVIVSDQRMPGMTGVEFLRRAKQLYPNTVRMVLSGYTELSSITNAINEAEIYKFLTKPWDDEHLKEHIAEAFQYKERMAA
jgi:EAL domain-containing protein (putative c-di-GMP-specific phosphodiesterase class I)/ActR/RegA family two-component response regulator